MVVLIEALNEKLIASRSHSESMASSCSLHSTEHSVYEFFDDL